MRAGRLDKLLLLLVLAGGVGGSVLAGFCGPAHAQAVAYPPEPNDPLDLDGLSVDYLRALELDAGSIRADTLHLGTLDAGSMRADSLRLGTLDAGIVWTPAIGNPDGGLVQVVTHGVALQPAALPTTCSSITGAYLTSIVSDLRPDGGLEVTPAWCDGQNLRALADAIPFAANSEAAGVGLAAGQSWLTVSVGPFSGEIWWCTFDVRAGGNGGGTYTVRISQGATVLCESPAIACTATDILWDGDPRPGVGHGPCAANRIQPRPADGGTNYTVHASFSSGCSQNPRGRLLCWARRQAIQ